MITSRVSQACCTHSTTHEASRHALSFNPVPPKARHSSQQCITRQAVYVQTRWRNHCCRENAISSTYSECVPVALVIRHAKRMRRIHFYPWPLCLYLFFHIISLTTRFSGKKKLLNIKCVFCFSAQILSETFLITRKFQRDIVINVKTSSRKVPVILVRF